MERVVQAYLEFCKKHKRHPSLEDLEAIGITYGLLKYHFKSYKKLRELLVKEKPSFFKQIKEVNKPSSNDVIRRIFKEMQA